MAEYEPDDSRNITSEPQRTKVSSHPNAHGHGNGGRKCEQPQVLHGDVEDRTGEPARRDLRLNEIRAGKHPGCGC